MEGTRGAADEAGIPRFAHGSRESCPVHRPPRNALGRRRYHARGAAVLFLDLDDFKTVNDSLGHVEGDILIGQVGARLAEAVRPGDTAARFGGDEFALLLDDVDEDQAVSIATRALAALNRPFEL